MILSPLHPGLALLTLAASVLAACNESPPDTEPAATPNPSPAPIVTGPHAEPKRGLDDAAIAAFEARPAGPRDFVINFGEPFIGFETRGNAVLVRDHTAGKRFAYVSRGERDETADGLVFAVPMESAWEGDPRGRWRIVIEQTTCDDEFSGEITDYTAWAQPAVRNVVRAVRLRGCARIVGTPQRWPDGIKP